MADALSPEAEAFIRDSFTKLAMMETMGATLNRLTPGEVEITAEVLPSCQQQHGVAHAGLSFALGDTAAGIAAMTLMEPGSGVMTAEMKINLMAPGTGLLMATGRVLRAGRRLTVVTADVWGDSPKGRVQVAALQGTMIPV